ncbi:MAG TPA: selenocysteine-specific translation elongation factor [Stellaceae bacterium]|jgi:selenocysteine-specific elongation factor|nr:selenocysteine-specific translation elongation factor [Stellaceae bacterium]
MIVGTAGHIDHGKSALVRALTGVDTDRLAEEKRRGISIDLGFAYVPVDDSTVLGFVDVPGHEDFIHNMLAGATGIDFVLLTVAADDGVMPQTVEHLAILDLLGLTRGLVALTKIDRAPPARRAEVTAEIGRLLADTGLANAGIVETSTVTGTGIDELRARIGAAARETTPRDTQARFRLAVDRCFTLRGVGTVVTGTVLSGAVSLGDTVTISPSGLPARVRSIHAQNQPAARGAAGQRCALNLAGEQVTKAAIARGDMVLDPSLHAPTQRIDARLRVLASEAKPIGLWLPARLHHGAAEVGARIVPLDGAPLRPGSEGWVQLVLDRPIAAAAGDRFVLRDPAARRTVGGGHFVDLRAPARRRRTPDRLRQLAALALADPAEAVARLLDLPPYYLDVAAFRRDRALPADGDTNMVLLGTVAFSAMRWAGLAQSITATLDQFHAAHGEAKGAAPETLRRAVEPRLPPPIFAAALAELARQKIILFEGGLARLPRHQSRLAPAQEALWQKIRPLLSDAERFRPPRLGELAKTLGVGDSELRRLLKLTARLGLVEEVVPDHFFLRGAVAEAAAIVGELAQTGADGQFGAAQLRDRLDTGRKNAIELLEYFDRRGITMRRGDLRRIDARKLELLK